ncbi:hypothetical protein CWE09_08225 [Aliidiomarina minuta]|uniref:Uncharacterized protein n=1 Tax=Aliidiomarina minuta TaxID=880057 RepID=A0A432W945_9GAMM|nr:prepilin-type N-terminal cleavage/methylation domain-containing protein [Aliidiomarina minuta]RUO26673.1 hypothetical protein CWE09_08225 [Aliidiomarina minuta]
MRAKGFTLVELIIVIVILGILSVYAAPRLFSTQDSDLTGIQASMISLFRLQQQRAMQDTEKFFQYGAYYGVAMDNSQLVGVKDCGSLPITIETDAIATGNLDLTLQGESWPICFNSLGCIGEQCGNIALEITLSGSGAASRQLCINTQGFIRSGVC